MGERKLTMTCFSSTRTALRFQKTRRFQAASSASRMSFASASRAVRSPSVSATARTYSGPKRSWYSRRALAYSFRRNRGSQSLASQTAAHRSLIFMVLLPTVLLRLLVGPGAGVILVLGAVLVGAPLPPPQPAAHNGENQTAADADGRRVGGPPDHIQKHLSRQ